MTVLWMALAGGLGAVCRFGLDGFVRCRVPGALPLGTVLVNVTGSLMLGVLTGLVLAHTADESIRVVVGTGFCGGYTTFSTASFETVRLVQQRRVGLALVNGVGTLVATVGVAALGLCLGLRA